jgi:outer membrane protein TolC
MMTGVLLAMLFLADTLHLDLERTVELALSQNPQIVAAASSKRAQTLRFWESVAGYLPEPSLSATYSDSETEIPLLGGYGGGSFLAETQKGYNLSFAIDQAIFDPDKISSILSNRYNARALSATLEETKRSIELSAKSAYFGVLQAVRTLEAREKALQSALENERLAEVKFRLGATSRLDKLRAHVEAGNARVQALEARDAFVSARRTLLNILGLSQSAELDLVDIEVVLESTELPSLEDLIETALRGRPKLALERESVNAYRLNLGYNLLSFLPKVNLSWYWNYADERLPPGTERFFDEATRYSGLRAQLTFNFFSYPFDVAASREEFLSSRASFKGAYLSVIQEVEDAYSGFQTGMKTYELSTVTRESAEEALRLAKAEYELGLITSMELFGAEASFLEAELAYISSFFNLLLAKETLNYAVGKEVLK